MTKTAVDFTLGQKKIENDRDLELSKQALTKALESDKIRISQGELDQLIKHQNANDFIDVITKNGAVKMSKANAQAYTDWFNTLVSYIIPDANTAVSSAAKMFNDISWHNKLTTAFDFATSLPANHRAGIVETNCIYPDAAMAQKWSDSFEDTNEIKDKSVYTAINGGIAQVYYIPVIEHDDNQIEVSELQNAVRALYVPVRQANSGAVNNYDQSDLFMLVYACSSLAELMTYFERCLKLVHPEHREMNTYDAWDFIRLSLVVGGNVNAAYWIANTPIIIETLNTLIRSINSILLPIGFDITKRRQLLNQCIFGHHDKWRSEEYIFIPRVFYKYDELNSQLVAVAFDPATVCANVTNLVNFITQFIRPIMNGTITAIMLGDMAKAYPNQVMILGEFSREIVGDSSSLFSDDEHVLMSIRNADLVGEDAIDTISDFNIKQGINATYDTYIYQGAIDAQNRCYLPIKGNDGTLTFDGNDQYDGVSYLPFHPIDVFYNTNGSNKVDFTRLSHFQTNQDSLDKDELMIATRFKNAIAYSIQVDEISGNEYSLIQSGSRVSQCGTELISHIVMNNYPNATEYSNNNLYNYKLNCDWNYSNAKDALNFEYPSWGAFVYPVDAGIVSKVSNAYHYLPAMTLTYGYVEQHTANAGDTYADYIYYTTSCVHGRQGYNYIRLQPTEFKYLNIASFGSLIKPQSANETNLNVSSRSGRSRSGSKDRADGDNTK